MPLSPAYFVFTGRSRLRRALFGGTVFECELVEGGWRAPTPAQWRLLGIEITSAKGRADNEILTRDGIPLPPRDRCHSDMDVFP